MKYTPEITERLKVGYTVDHLSTKELALELSVPERSVIAKLSSMGVYERKKYTNKRGEVPVRKAEQIENIARLLNVNLELLESLEKVNKSVLILLERELGAKKVDSDPKS